MVAYGRTGSTGISDGRERQVKWHNGDMACVVCLRLSRHNEGVSFCTLFPHVKNLRNDALALSRCVPRIALPGAPPFLTAPAIFLASPALCTSHSCLRSKTHLLHSA